VVGVAVGLFVAAGGGHKKVVTVSGLSGSEKIPYFQDPAVVKRLKELGFAVNVESAGSREIATKFDLKRYDFAFPAGVPAAQRIRLRYKTSAPYTTFFTPMAIATFKPIANLLVKVRVARKQGAYYLLDVKRYLALVRKNTRWTDLRGNTAYPVEKSILITSTDVRSSNSAAMYLSLASFVANGGIVDNRAAASAVLPEMEQLFLKQGFVASSSEEPFDDYLSIGIGKSPMVMIYEAQYVAHAGLEDGSIRPDMTLMYPQPTVLSKQTFVPLSPVGDRLGNALTHDDKLQQLAIEHGFRTSRPGAFQAFTRRHHIGVATDVINAVDPPSYEMLEYMIGAIERAYRAQEKSFKSGGKATTVTTP
jgi:hypothetical protein